MYKKGFERLGSGLLIENILTDIKSPPNATVLRLPDRRDSKTCFAERIPHPQPKKKGKSK